MKMVKPLRGTMYQLAYQGNPCGWPKTAEALLVISFSSSQSLSPFCKTKTQDSMASTTAMTTTTTTTTQLGDATNKINEAISVSPTSAAGSAIKKAKRPASAAAPKKASNKKRKTGVTKKDLKDKLKHATPTEIFDYMTTLFEKHPEAADVAGH
jgi:hypothetical protein